MKDNGKGRLAMIGLFLALTVTPVHATEDARADSERQQCTENLQKIYQAIRAYQLDHRDLPKWLSDLVPKYLPDPAVLLCPAQLRTGTDATYGMKDPKLPCSYLYEFCNQEISESIRGMVPDWTAGMTMKEWKVKQLLTYGPDVPLVRCWHHEPLLNLAFSGDIYESDPLWEAKAELEHALRTTGTDPLPLEKWTAAGTHPHQYVMGIDPDVRYADQPAGRIFSVTNKIEGFGTYLQQFKADTFRERRVRLSAQVKTEDVEEWAGLWMRVDGSDRAGLTFDNMQDRPIKGTTDWAPYAVVVDVPEQGQMIAAGIGLAGTGKVWIADVKFDEVSEDVAITDLLQGNTVEELAQTAAPEQPEELSAPVPADSPLVKELVGAWILVGTPGNVGEPPQSGGRMKCFGRGNWVVVQPHPETGNAIYLHGGTYTLSGNEYTETTKYYGASSTYTPGPPLKFKISVKGDTYTQIGLGNPFSEAYKRLAPATASSSTGQELFGTWKLISAKYGGRSQNLAAMGTTLKRVTPTQFLWLSYGNDKRVNRAAGGTCTITADTYAETADYGISEDFGILKGKTHKFNWKVEGNQWHHTGQLANGLAIEEIWERVD
jgi:hypothetical protein